MNTDDPARLWRVQLSLECKAFTDRGTLVEVPCANPDELATCHVVSYVTGGVELVFADTAPGWFVDRARQIDIRRYLSRAEDVALDIGRGESAIEIVRCSTYQFVSPVSEFAGTARLRYDSPEAVTAVANMDEDEVAVAQASSSRSNGAAAELWVRTEPEHRRRGYAKQVSTAWASAVTSAGKIAFYSHLDHNMASRSLAADLGVVPLFDLVGLTLAPE